MDNPFDIVNCKENKESQARLINLLITGSAILFIGSGSSRRLSYPLWEDLILILKDLLPTQEKKEIVERLVAKSELLLAAEVIKCNVDENDYCSIFKEQFKHKSPSHDELHKSLVNLKVKGFITTNYDPVIEVTLRSIQPRDFVSDFVLSDTNKRDIHRFIKSLSTTSWNERHILYLHGRFDMPSTTILSYGDYVLKYDGLEIKSLQHYSQLINGEIDIKTFENRNCLRSKGLRTLHYKTIYLIMASQRIIYFGYGLRDPFLNKITNDIQDDFHTYYDDFHFALISSNEAKKWTEKDYKAIKEEWSLKGIELVLYKDNEEYTGIDEFIQMLPPECIIQSMVKGHTVNIPEVVNNSKDQATEEQKEDLELNKILRNKVQRTAEELKRL